MPLRRVAEQIQVGCRLRTSRDHRRIPHLHYGPDWRVVGPHGSRAIGRLHNIVRLYDEEWRTILIERDRERVREFQREDPQFRRLPSLSLDECLRCNCVGQAFGLPYTTIDVHDLHIILDEVAFEQRQPGESQPGDLVIYQASSGLDEHVGVVVSVESGDVRVRSKWGSSFEYEHRILAVQPQWRHRVQILHSVEGWHRAVVHEPIV